MKRASKAFLKALEKARDDDRKKALAAARPAKRAKPRKPKRPATELVTDPREELWIVLWRDPGETDWNTWNIDDDPRAASAFPTRKRAAEIVREERGVNMNIGAVVRYQRVVLPAFYVCGMRCHP